MDAKPVDLEHLEQRGQGEGPPISPPSRRHRFVSAVWPRVVWGLGLVALGTLVNWAVFVLLLAKPIWLGCFGNGSAFGAHTGGGPGSIVTLLILLVACSPSLLSSLVFVLGFPLAYVLIAKKRVMAAAGQTAFDLNRPEIAARIEMALQGLGQKLGQMESSDPSIRKIRARVGELLPFWGRALLKRALKKIPEEEIGTLYHAARASSAPPSPFSGERGPGREPDPGPEALGPTINRLLDRIQIDVPTRAPRTLAIANLCAFILAWVAWTLVVQSARGH